MEKAMQFFAGFATVLTLNIIFMPVNNSPILLGFYAVFEIFLLIGAIIFFRRKPPYRTMALGAIVASCLKIAFIAAVGSCMLMLTGLHA